MRNEPKNFLINLAVLKVNWDENRDILHNFMPLVGYAIDQLEAEVVSVEELKIVIDRVAQFTIPSGALEVMIRRASRQPYNYVERRDRVYRRLRGQTGTIEFEKHRHTAASIFSDLSRLFHEFCEIHFPGTEVHTASAFFEILYDVAPKVIESAMAAARSSDQLTTSRG